MDYFINHEEVLWFDKNYYGIYQGRNFRDPWELLDLPVRSLAFYGSREKSFVLQEAFPELSVMLFSKNFGADVVEAEYSKAKGIDRLCEYFDIDKKDTYAFGDSLNDIEMLKMVNVGVAMGNAQDEAKAVADYITDKIDEDGIKNALVHFGLI
jgi:Cof subfamily protein (haloacid dehalogenase superfamily)